MPKSEHAPHRAARRSCHHRTVRGRTHGRDRIGATGQTRDLEGQEFRGRSQTYTFYNGVYPLSQSIRDDSARRTISKQYEQKDASGKKRKHYLNFQGTFSSSAKVKGTMYVTSSDTGKSCGTQNTASPGSPLTWKASRTGS